MSDLIDRNVLKAKMYQEAFESDTDMQKWDSGCWIRYKLFEKVVDSAPTVPYAPRWHRVEEPPKSACDCLMCWTTIHDAETGEVTGHGFWCEMGWYEDGLLGSVGFYCQSRHEETPVRVEPDYWMPIEPPKGDA